MIIAAFTGRNFVIINHQIAQSLRRICTDSTFPFPIIAAVIDAAGGGGPSDK